MGEKCLVCFKATGQLVSECSLSFGAFSNDLHLFIYDIFCWYFPCSFQLWKHILRPFGGPREFLLEYPFRTYGDLENSLSKYPFRPYGDLENFFEVPLDDVICFKNLAQNTFKKFYRLFN